MFPNSEIFFQLNAFDLGRFQILMLQNWNIYPFQWLSNLNHSKFQTEKFPFLMPANLDAFYYERI